MDEQRQLPVPPPPIPIASSTALSALAPAPAASQPYGVDLDAHQLAVVDWTEGPLLVAAAAGSGKSATLVARTERLVRSGVPPEEILNLAYNRSAAETLRLRLAARLGPMLGSRVGVFTFHAFALMCLRRYIGDHWQMLSILEGPQVYRLASQAARMAGISSDPKAYLRASDVLRESLIDLDAPDAALRLIHGIPSVAGNTQAGRKVFDFCRAWQQAKMSAWTADFADVVWSFARLAATGDPRLLQARSYSHVHVDEGQDLSLARFAIAMHLAAGARSLVVVGDGRQAINSFSGADPKLLDRYRAAGAALKTLPVNRRSTGAIVELANRISADREWNLGGPAAAAPDAPAGIAIRALRFATPTEEAREIACEIRDRTGGAESLIDARGAPRFVCLVRTNAQSADLEHAFIAAAIPVRVRGSKGGAWTSATGRVFLSYLRAAEGRVDDSLASAANRPNRYLKRAIVEGCVGDGARSIVEALLAHGSKAAADFARDLMRLGMLAWPAKVGLIGRWLLRDLKERAEESAGRGEIDDEALSPDDDALAAVAALTRVAIEARSLVEIESGLNRLEAAEQASAVEISTIHRWKGQEAEVVFLCGADEGVLPHQKCFHRPEAVEEERRLFYVAATRAKSELIVSCCTTKPSRFLSQIPSLRAGVSEEPTTKQPAKEKEARPRSDRGAAGNSCGSSRGG